MTIIGLVGCLVGISTSGILTGCLPHGRCGGGEFCSTDSSSSSSESLSDSILSADLKSSTSDREVSLVPEFLFWSAGGGETKVLFAAAGSSRFCTVESFCPSRSSGGAS